MRIVEHILTSAQTIHANRLKDIIRGVKNSNKFYEQIEDIYSFFITRGQSVLSKESIRKGIIAEYKASTVGYDIINSQIKHLEFSEFMIRFSNLKAFKLLVDEPEESSEMLVKAMFAVGKIATANQLAKKNNNGAIPLEYGENLSADIDEEGFEKFCEDAKNSLSSADASMMEDAMADMSDLGMAIPFLNDIFDLVDEDVAGTPGTSNGTIQDSSIWKDRITYFVNKFTLNKSAIYDLARNLETTLDHADFKTKEYENSPNPQNMENIDIEQGKDLQRATPLELIQDDDILFGKIAKSELQQKAYQNPKGKSQCMYVLCDSSGSMHGRRHNMAVATIISLCRKSIKDGDKFFVRLFDNHTHPRTDVTTGGLAKKMEYELLTKSFSGGGTNISNAIKTAVDDILKFKKDPDSDIGKSEILLITDAEDNFSDFTEIGKTMKDNSILLHSVVIGNNKSTKALEDISDTFNNASVDAKGAMSIVKKVKK